MQKFLFAFYIIFSNLLINAQSPTFQWAKQMGGSGSEAGYAMAVDAAGNIYTTGFFQAGADFDPGAGTFTLNAVGTHNAYVAKLDASGNFVWAKNVVENPGFSYGLGICIDNAGSLYLTGLFEGVGDFDPGATTFSITSAGLQDFFISKLDANGNFIWAKAIGGTGYEAGNGIAVDAMNNVYTTGYFQATVDFDPGAGTTTLTAMAGVYDGFILKVTSAGNFSYAKQIASNSSCLPYAITLDALANVYTTGYFAGQTDFDSSPGTFTLNAIGTRDIYVSRLDASGNFSWAKQFGSAGQDAVGYALKTDAANNVYSTGNFAGTMDMDPGAGTFTVVSAGSNDVYISKFSSSGNFIWGKNFGGSANDISFGIDIDANNNVYTTGQFSGVADFDPSIGTFSITAAGNIDLFISKIDASGNLIWVRSIGGASSDVFGYGLVVDPSKNIYTTGSFNLIEDFDTGSTTYTLSSVGFTDIFVHKMSQCTSPPTPTITAGSSALLICNGNSTTLTATSTGTVNWYSTSTSTTVLGSGTYTTPVLSAGTYTYFAGTTTCTNSITRATITVTVNVCTSLENLQTSNYISVFPNPFDRQFVISTPTVEGLNYEVTNSIGQIVITSSGLPTQNTIVNMDGHAAGIYVIKIYSNKTLVKIEKVIKK